MEPYFTCLVKDLKSLCYLKVLKKCIQMKHVLYLLCSKTETVVNSIKTLGV